MSSWQPIETAPKDGTVILGLEIESIVGGESIRIPIRWDSGENDWQLAWCRWGGDDSSDCTPTHWQPLPPPPK